MGRKRKQQDSKDVKLVKTKLKLYGEYTQQISELKVWLLDLKAYLKLHNDWPEQAAKEMRIHGLDNKHPPGQQMNIDKTTAEIKIKKIEAARSALGLDAWLNSLSRDDRQIIRLVFEDGYSYQEAAPMVNLSRSGIDYRINVICKSQDASS